MPSIMFLVYNGNSQHMAKMTGEADHHIKLGYGILSIGPIFTFLDLVLI